MTQAVQQSRSFVGADREAPARTVFQESGDQVAGRPVHVHVSWLSRYQGFVLRVGLCESGVARESPVVFQFNPGTEQRLAGHHRLGHGGCYIQRVHGFGLVLGFGFFLDA